MVAGKQLPEELPVATQDKHVVSAYLWDYILELERLS